MFVKTFTFSIEGVIHMIYIYFSQYIQRLYHQLQPIPCLLLLFRALPSKLLNMKLYTRSVDFDVLSDGTSRNLH